MREPIIFLLLKPAGPDSPSGYVAGAVIALIILAYLLYSLIKPEKF